MRYLLVLLLLSGCSTKAPVVSEVFIPVPTRIVVSHIERPELAIHQLTDEDKERDGKIAQAYVATVGQLQNYATLLETILEQIQNDYGTRTDSISTTDIMVP